MKDLTLEEVKDRCSLSIVKDIDPRLVCPGITGALVLNATGRIRVETIVVSGGCLLSEPDTVLPQAPRPREIIDRAVVNLTQLVANRGRKIMLAPGSDNLVVAEYDLDPFNDTLFAIRFTQSVSLGDRTTTRRVSTPPSSVVILDPVRIDPSTNIGVIDITPSFGKELTIQ